MSKFPEILILLRRKSSCFLSDFSRNFFLQLWFSSYIRIESFFLNLNLSHSIYILYYRKNFYSILTNLSNLSHSKSSIVPFVKFRSDVKKALIKHFPTMLPFANILQNRSSYEFPNICKIISVLESLLIKLHA